MLFDRLMTYPTYFIFINTISNGRICTWKQIYKKKLMHDLHKLFYQQSMCCLFQFSKQKVLYWEGVNLNINIFSFETDTWPLT
jgi:hypothetical protein